MQRNPKQQEKNNNKQPTESRPRSALHSTCTELKAEIYPGNGSERFLRACRDGLCSPRLPRLLSTGSVKPRMGSGPPLKICERSNLVMTSPVGRCGLVLLRVQGSAEVSAGSGPGQGQVRAHRVNQSTCVVCSHTYIAFPFVHTLSKGLDENEVWTTRLKIFSSTARVPTLHSVALTVSFECLWTH